MCTSSFRTSLVAQMVKHLPTMLETQVQSLGWEDPLEKEVATHSSTLAWKIPWTEEHGRLQSMRSEKSRTQLNDFTLGVMRASLSKPGCLWAETPLPLPDRVPHFRVYRASPGSCPGNDTRAYWTTATSPLRAGVDTNTLQ